MRQTRIYRVLFPVQTRKFKFKRWVKISLRTMHLIGIAGIGAFFFFDIPRTNFLPYLYLTVFSGISFVILEIWGNAIWLIQLRGVLLLLKIILLSLIPFVHGHEATILLLVIIISSVISHAPGDVRYFSVIHGKRMDILS